MARPTKLTPETQEKIITAIEQGATYELAAQYGGVSYDTFNNWMNRARAETTRLENPRTKEDVDEAPYVQFFNAVKEAEGRAAVKWLIKIEKAASDGNWQAAAWKLERRYPKEYGRTVHEHKIDDWRSQAIEDIKAGRILYKELAQAFDDDLATTLFREAGISVSAR